MITMYNSMSTTLCASDKISLCVYMAGESLIAQSYKLMNNIRKQFNSFFSKSVGNSSILP